MSFRLIFHSLYHFELSNKKIARNESRNQQYCQSIALLHLNLEHDVLVFFLKKLNCTLKIVATQLRHRTISAQPALIKLVTTLIK